MDLDQTTTDNINSTTTNNDTTTTMATQATLLKSDYDVDVVRLIGQYLKDKGLKQTSESLLRESGLTQLDHPIAIKFRDHIMSGDWEKANQILEDVASLANLNANRDWSPVVSTTTFSGTKQNGCDTSMSQPNSSNVSVNMEQQRKSNIKTMRLAIAEQKFLELIEDNDRIGALRCLRCEITPLCDNLEKVQFLATLLMCRTNDEIRLKADWPGKGQLTRQILFDRIGRFIPAPILLPPKRLETLLNQAIRLQRERCVLHLARPMRNQQGLKTTYRSTQNRSIFPKRISSSTIITEQDHLGCDGACISGDKQQQQRLVFSQNGCCNSNETTNRQENNVDIYNDPDIDAQDDYRIDLKSDHICPADQFPLQTRQILESHNSEVWFCKFSGDGTKLATGGLGGKIIIWTLDIESKLLKEKCTLECPCFSISCLSWSPDDTYLLACGSEDQPHLWIWNMITEQMHATIAHKVDEESTTTCSWHKSGRRFAAASIRGTFNIYDVNGNKCGSRDGVRVQCLSFMNKDPRFLLAADTLNRIRAYRVKSCDTDPEINLGMQSEEDDVLEEKYPIMSFTIDPEDKYLAINIKEHGVHLWDLKRRTLMRVFLGVTQRNITIFSTFSSPDSTFVASGSEDGRVYIFHIARDQPIAILNGHNRCVNCTSWNPRFPELLVSVSDDRCVRLWAPPNQGQSLNKCHTITN